MTSQTEEDFKILSFVSGTQKKLTPLPLNTLQLDSLAVGRNQNVQSKMSKLSSMFVDLENTQHNWMTEEFIYVFPTQRWVCLRSQADNYFKQGNSGKTWMTKEMMLFVFIVFSRVNASGIL